MFQERRILLNIFLCLFGFCIGASSANKSGEIYHFLNVPGYAKLAGLGGENVSMQVDDVNQIYVNPSLLSSSLKNRVSLSYINYLADANGGMASYAYALDSLNFFGFNFIFMGYGKMDGYDKDGIQTGTFSAGDFSWNLVYARKLNKHFKIGVSLKPVYSHIDVYNSFGLAFDVGANYYMEEHDFSIGFVARNFGIRFSDYYKQQESERLPANLQLGLTKGLDHAPFRFSVTYDHLNRWNLDYKHTQRGYDLIDNKSEEEDDIRFADMLFRHFVFGMEVVLKGFHIDFAYNHRRNREYALSEARAINGFSFGAGFKVYKFNLDAAYVQYAPSGGTFTLSLSSCIDLFMKE